MKLRVHKTKEFHERLTVPSSERRVWTWFLGYLVSHVPPLETEQWALQLGAKRSGRKADNSPPSSAQVNNAWNYTSTPPIRLRGAMHNFAQGTFNFSLLQVAGNRF